MILIKNGEVHIGNRDIINNCDILIDNSKIIKVGKNISSEGIDEIIDATDCTVFPGFVDAAQNWGAVGPGWGDDDLNETTDPITPHLDSVYAFDHDAMNFQSAYEYGVTSFGFMPTFNNIVGGRACAFKTYGKNPYEMLIKKDIAITASLSNSAKNTYRSRGVCPMTKLGIASLLKQALFDAQKYEGDEKENPKSFYLKKILNNEIPLIVNCSTKAEINAVSMIADQFNFDVVLIGAYNLSKADINNKHFKKILLGNLTDSMLPENYHIDADALKLIKADTLMAVCSNGDSSSGGKEALLWNAILYFQKGFDCEEILEMITLNPAKILGIDNQVGSIEEGKDADIIIWSNNPILTFDARVKHSFLNGEDLTKLERRTTCW
ncbi:MAG: amidohydrolase family protein [Oscillospiraceae bacterium]